MRSDSSIFSLSWPWEPWVRKEGVADGDHIREYMEDTAHKRGIFPHIHFNTHVLSADWDSATDTWTVHALENGTRKTYRGRFVFFGSGYYNYDEGYTPPDFPGLENFKGATVHPQFWPEDLDYTGKKVIVVGSGATAISLIPALAQKAAKVTMLQRSPTYLLAGSRVNPIIEAVRKVMPPRRISHAFARYFAVAFESVVWFLARTVPGGVAARSSGRRTSAGCLRAIRSTCTSSRATTCGISDYAWWPTATYSKRSPTAARWWSPTTSTASTTPGGVMLKSGQHLEADIIVTATGLQLQALGGVRITLDGNEIKPQERFSYKAHMLEDVPNLIWCIGYTNASWTLRADMTARAAAKLIEYMNSHGYTHAFPHLEGSRSRRSRRGTSRPGTCCATCTPCPSRVSSARGWCGRTISPTRSTTTSSTRSTRT